MNKRSAMLIAASIVGVLAIGGTAFALGFTGPTASAASEQTPAATGPIVRTHTKTVVVHRQAVGSAAADAQAAPSTSSPSPSMSGDDDGSHHDNEGSDDHGHGESDGPDDHGDHGNEGPDDHGDDDD